MKKSQIFQGSQNLRPQVTAGAGESGQDDVSAPINNSLLTRAALDNVRTMLLSLSFV